MVLKTNITEMFGIKHPIASAAMGPFRTTELAIAVAEAGGLGMISHANQSMDGREPDAIVAMKKNLDYVVEHTDGIFGFNIRTSRLTVNCDKLISETAKHIMENPKLKKQCLYALSSAGSAARIPRNEDFIKLRKDSDIKHFHVAPALWLADKCVAVGCDGLVVTGFEGGGHQSYEKVGGMVLLQQVQQKHPDIPKIACGGFATGSGLAAALAIGAGGIAMGSRFIASKDSEFHENYKGVVPPSKASDTLVRTGSLGTIRLWRNKYALAKGLVKTKEEKMDEEKTLSDHRTVISQEELAEELRKDAKAAFAAYQGDMENGGVLLGQSIGIIDKIESVSDIIESVIKDAEKALKKAATFVQ
ncbi:MAG: nitronate monooxygenase [Candidatus Lokiarchaeota archaeon]|nr:nitronate monooxygenase [Candidatus Lokiarchaeota archaeon]